MRPERKLKLRTTAHRRQKDVAVLLDNIIDAHNIGAVLRTCDSVGVQQVDAVNFEDSEGKKNFALGKYTSSGSRKWVDVVQHEDSKKCLFELKQRYGRLLAADYNPESKSLYQFDLTTPVVLMFGNESKGFSKEVLEFADATFYIPQMGLTQSLNISVACAVTLYELLRQRNIKGMYDMSNPEDWHLELEKEFFQRHKDQYKGRVSKK